MFLKVLSKVSVKKIDILSLISRFGNEVSVPIIKYECSLLKYQSFRALIIKIGKLLSYIQVKSVFLTLLLH